MSSIWLATDAAPSKTVKKSLRGKQSRSSHVPTPYLGVFTDDPAIIGQWLPRPVTPFVPAPESLNFSKQLDTEEGSPEVMCDSPAADGLFDFGHPKLQGIAVGISVY
jgi:hypothetical protein